MDAAVIWTAVGALGVVVAAGVAAWAARQSRDSAIKANAAAETLAAIERDRQHDELAPDFAVKFTATAEDRANLLVTLTGGRMDRLDEVTVTILDETGKDDWGGGLPTNVTQDEAAAFVWGAVGVPHGCRRAGSPAIGSPGLARMCARAARTGICSL